MKQKLTPLNIAAALLVVLAITFFVKAITTSDHSMDGWFIIFAIFSFVTAIIFFVASLFIQSLTIKYSWRLTMELIVLLLLAFFYFWR